MPKNLILVHLESISNTILWQYREELKTIWEIWRRSYVYNHFYTDATSTEMSLLYLDSGSSTVVDWASLFHQKSPFPPKVLEEMAAKGPISLTANLHFGGYGRSDRIYKIFEGFDMKGVDIAPAGGMVSGPAQDPLLPLARSALAQAKMDGLPFYFMFTMSITHITAEDDVKRAATSFSDRFRLAYLRLDNAVNKLMGMLVELKLLENSVVVFYGDHGDELWAHGLNKGWCHVITPYASLNWTPLFIYEHGTPPGSTDQLASMIDLKETLIKRLLPDYKPEDITLNPTWTNHLGQTPFFKVRPEFASGTLPPFRSAPFSGIDLNSETRELAFSQNLFALQREYNDVGKALTKGYAVTDGTYRVTVTSGGDNPKEGGLEFFCDPIDPTNARNLLDFFKLDANGDIGDFYPPPEAVGDEFRLAFNPEAVEHLRITFQKLKLALHAHIRGKEEYAMQFNDGNGMVMPEYAFKHSRRRSYRFM